MRIALLLLPLLLAGGLMNGCANGPEGKTPTEQARQVPQGRPGIVTAVRPVIIRGRQSGAGAMAGGTAGGIAGSDRGNVLGAILGSVVGGVLGSQAEEKLTRKQGTEITVKLDSGRIIAIVQEQRPERIFLPGDRVRVLDLYGNARIVHD